MFDVMPDAPEAVSMEADPSDILRRLRQLLPPAFDALMWAFALVLATALRLESLPGNVLTGRLLEVIAVAVVLQVAIGYLTGLYRVRWRLASFEEATSLATTVGAATLLLLALDLLASSRSHGVPLGALIIAAPFTFVGATGARSAWRMIDEHRSGGTVDAQAAIVFGAGKGGQQLIESLIRFADSPLKAVALLDDHPSKQSYRIRHLRVVGGRSEIERVAQESGAQALVIAIPSASSPLIRDVSERALNAGLSVFVLPPVADLLRPSSVGSADLRRLTDEDLLGRNPVSTDLESIAGYIQGRRVLVTGAGGSIGSELCRQLHSFAPESLVMLDRDESGLHQTQLLIEGRALLDVRSLVVCDIRDREALVAVFDEHRPEVVFHAAALKHLPLLEMWPLEAVKTNVFGTHNLLEEARRVGTSTFVNVSTDKAANPTSVLGYSKRLAEQLTAESGITAEAGTRYLSVRFGNVLGSRGSVLTSFRTQLAAGRPITVTHPDITRYFMTIQEAVQLVVQAGAIGASGEVMVLEMGEPVSILSVARQLAAEAPTPVDIEYTGLRPGEKLHEELFGAGEEAHPSPHPLISRTPVPPLDIDTIQSELHAANAAMLKDKMSGLCARAAEALSTWDSANAQAVTVKAPTTTSSARRA
jgi:FlaA1/EpsC-like NDP-sugar epimerase